MEVAASELEREAEEALVVGWRFEILSRAGFPRDEAFLLARRDVDVRVAAKLLARGCPLATAMRILL